VLRPGWSELEGDLERLAEKNRPPRPPRVHLPSGHGALGQSAQGARAVPKLAAIYTDRLQMPDEALDMHRRILQLQPSALPSLEVVVGYQRKSEQWRDLRDSLEQWLAHNPPEPTAPRVARLIEIAALSRERLADPEAALAATRSSSTRPGQRAGARRRPVAHRGSGGPRARAPAAAPRARPHHRPAAVDLQLAIAKIQEEEFEDVAGAILTLRGLIGEAGPVGPGYDQLHRLLGCQKAWPQQYDLVEAHALALTDAKERQAALKAAVAFADDHPPPPRPSVARSST